MDRGKEDGKQAMQAHRSTLVLRQKGGSRVWQPWWVRERHRKRKREEDEEGGTAWLIQ